MSTLDIPNVPKAGSSCHEHFKAIYIVNAFDTHNMPLVRVNIFSDSINDIFNSSGKLRNIIMFPGYFFTEQVRNIIMFPGYFNTEQQKEVAQELIFFSSLGVRMNSNVFLVCTEGETSLFQSMKIGHKPPTCHRLNYNAILALIHK